MTAAAVVLAAGIATLGRLSPWVAAVLVPAPLLAVQLSREVAVLLAIPFALAGAALGAGALRLASAPPARVPRT